MNIGIIGLGDIAQKAYLPVYSRIEGITLHLCTRNKKKLEEIGAKYRITHLYTNIDDLLESGIQAAFVHSSTESHEELVRKLLMNDIHVYVEKPITYHFTQSKALVKLAKEKQTVLMTGFNRRFAPSYQLLKEVQYPNTIVMQKNRLAQPADIRTFIYDDFIHVVDTIRYLFPYSIDHLSVSGMVKEGLLYHVVVTFKNKEGPIAIGMMNRDSGTNEERVEVMSSIEKRVTLNVNDTFIYKGKEATKRLTSDWESTLHKRGFEQIVTAFLQEIKKKSVYSEDSLITHEMCEFIVNELTQMD
ncbi:Gfo/Idh/MocA family protein [Bacillus alkalicellulosilyticus]|uniref:Gfo/Idh/MocA family protein n=1 Tax=Alkalihalobacterium alkalicellulosilyticum TaxID=1912214 RepID=UPI000996E072|nr:Gfo/Idh/MocA family oxidoreductase [Bacillus alkalicellulosilyticus]